MRCPVCNETEFEFENDNMVCEKCGWMNDSYQLEHPNYINGVNGVSLNQAKKNFNENGTIYSKEEWEEFKKLEAIIGK